MPFKKLGILLIQVDKTDANVFVHDLKKILGHSIFFTHVENLDAGILLLKNQAIELRSEQRSGAACQETIDVIFCDLDLPDSNDLSSISKLYSIAPHAPIIAVLKYNDENTILEAIGLGAQDCVVKGSLTSGVMASEAFITDTLVRKLKASIIRKKTELDSINRSHDKTQFLANMSHEIRTPINAILGMTNLTLESSLTVEQKDHLETIKLSADSLLYIVNDILDFSKIASDKIELENVDFDLKEALDDCKTVFEYAVKRKSLTFAMEISDDIPNFIHGDSGRFRQILHNLVNNAIKFTASGIVKLKVYSLEKSQQTARLRFEISDTGIGIPKAALAKLFDAFTQADESNTRRFGGTGLGLAISKKLVHMMSGKIGVTSQDGVGTTFWFELTLPIVAKDIVQLKAIHQDRQLRTGRILLVEDNAFNQKVAINCLEKYGYRIHAVASGNECLDSLRNIEYDLILMDCQMPDMDGYEATRLIRTSPNLKDVSHIPIIALTANAIAGDREKCLTIGMNDYVAKPVNFEKLSVLIEAWIHKIKTPVLKKDEQILPEIQYLDMEMLTQIIDEEDPDSYETLNQLVQSFLDKTPGRIRQIQDQLFAKDHDAASRSAHSLKSASGYMGVTKMMALCQLIETKAKQANAPQANQQVNANGQPEVITDLMLLAQQLSQEFVVAEKALKYAVNQIANKRSKAS